MNSPLKIVSINKELAAEQKAIKELSEYLGAKWRRKQQQKINNYFETKIQTKSKSY